MALSLTSIFYAALAYFIYTIIRSYVTERRFQKFARENGCEDPKRVINNLPWGIDGVYRVVMAASNGQDILDDLVVPRFAMMKAWTMIGTGLFGQQIITTAEPKNVQALLATKFKDFETGERRRKQFGALLGNNIFTSDGEFWQHSRALFRPVFNRENINNLEETERASRILIDVLPAGEGRWTEVVDLLPLFYRFTLDTATAFLFGHTTDSQLAAAGRLSTSEQGSITSMAVDQEFVESFTAAQEWLSIRIRMQGAYWLVQAPKWYRATRIVRKFVNHYVKLALNQQVQFEKAEAGEAHKYNLLRELAQECRDPIELRDQLLGILGAGRDTTAGLLGWTFILLAQNPKIYLKLREAIISDFGTSAKADLSILTFSKLKSCRYLQFVINESLRLYPLVPFNNRVAARDTTLPTGGGRDGTKPVAIRKGQLVNFVIYQFHRRKDIWGEDANSFRPERWDGRKIDWSFVPFSGGPRICLGQQYAITEASFLIVRILQEFDSIEWNGESGRVTKGFSLTMYPGKGVPVRLRRAHQ